MTNQNRYELKSGKFGYYFYDNDIQIDLSLNMVLTKLNYCNNRINESELITRKLTDRNYILKNKINLLKEL